MARSAILQSKWIVGTAPDQSIGRVARLALCQRLSVLQMSLRLAAKRADRDAEYVHQLRVATRRAHAALKVFGSLVPPRRAEKLHKQLKKLRRAAGAARDLDVLHERLTRRAETSSDSRLEPVIDRIEIARDEAQVKLVLERKRLKRDDVDANIQALLKRVHWRGSLPEPAFHEVARQYLKSSMDEFFAAATAELSNLAQLHEVRLAGKHLRYAMELLAGVFEPVFKQRLYAAVQDIQDRLGRVNDHVTASTLFAEWASQSDVGDAGLLAELAGEERDFAEATRRQFQAWFPPRRVEDLRRDFERIKLAATNGKPEPATTSRGIA